MLKLIAKTLSLFKRQHKPSPCESLDWSTIEEQFPFPHHFGDALKEEERKFYEMKEEALKNHDYSEFDEHSEFGETDDYWSRVWAVEGRQVKRYIQILNNGYRHSLKWRIKNYFSLKGGLCEHIDENGNECFESYWISGDLLKYKVCKKFKRTIYRSRRKA